MKEYLELMYKAFAIILFITLFMPLLVLIKKLIEYIQQNEFQEWWISILWILILPLVTLSICIAKNKIGEKK